MTESDEQTMYGVLAELTFPAQCWEILTSADMYGADAVTLERLRRLPTQRAPYHDMREVLDALDAVPAPAVRSTTQPRHSQVGSAQSRMSQAESGFE